MKKERHIMMKEISISNRFNPIGLDETPSFSWKLESKNQNVIQKSYQIQVISNGRMFWNSEIVESEESVHILYEGDTLTPMTQYQVQISVWDNYGEMSQEQASFETGLLGMDWMADWITHEMPETGTTCPTFYQEISCDKKVKKARLFATALGVYEAYIGGKKVGDAFMAPGWTSYHHRLAYQTYDITSMISDKFELSFTVGNGWYKGFLNFADSPNHYGDRVALLGMMVLEYEDGSVDFVGTGSDWNVRTSETVYSEIYYGETNDFTKKCEELGKAVVLSESVKIGELVSQEAPMVRVTQRFENPQKIVTPKGELVFDFGQNMAGLVEVKLPKLIGKELVIKHAETLDKEGNFYTENLRTAKSIDTYIYDEAKEGTVVMPHFTFHGFRYICVEGVSEEITSDYFTACTMHTDMKKTGSFSCDNPLVKQLQSNIVWGQRGNFLDIPTDCPQRNERLGWTGDAQVFCGTAGFHYDTANFFRKWLRDMASETTPEWGVPHVVPNILGEEDGAAAWSDAATIIPWKLYEIYADKQMLAEQFPMMCMWVDYIHSKVSENGLWQTGFQYGDWLALDIESGSTDRTGGTDKYLVANAYYAYSTGIVRDAAKVLGNKELEEKYAALYEEIIEAINNEFITKTGRLVSETQTGCVLMLYFNLAKPEYRDRIRQTLETNIGAHRNHLTTGFVGTPYLCHCLSENNMHLLANEIFLKEDFPGWMYAVKKGATTIWERWNSILPNGDFDESGMNSLNHYAYGSIGSWLYEKVAGIRTEEPGYKVIRIQPTLTKGFTQCEAGFESIYGTIESKWSCKDGKIIVDIKIPANTKAILVLPEKNEEIKVGSGTYHYEYETTTNLTMDKYTLESTLGDLVKEELGRSLFEQMVPGMLDNPMIKFAYEMTISELIIQAPDSQPLYQAVIDALNQENLL